MIFHRHNGIDAPQILVDDIDGLNKDEDVMNKTDAQTIAGVKTFSSIPIVPTPTSDNNPATKKYVSDNVVPYTLKLSSTHLQDSADTNRSIAYNQTTYVKKKEITYNEANCTITVKFDLADANGAGGCYGRIYKNGSAVGTERNCGSTSYITYSEDISVNTGDELQLYVKYDDSGGGTGGACRNFRLYYFKELNITAGTVNL